MSRVADQCEQASPFTGTVNANKSFFDAPCVKEKQRRGTYGKTIVFHIFQQKSKAYTKIVPDCSKAMLPAIIRGLEFSLWSSSPIPDT